MGRLVVADSPFFLGAFNDHGKRISVPLSPPKKDEQEWKDKMAYGRTISREKETWVVCIAIPDYLVDNVHGEIEGVGTDEVILRPILTCALKGLMSFTRKKKPASSSRNGGQNNNE